MGLVEVTTENSKGWKLPTGDAEGAFNNLMTRANIYTYHSTTDSNLRQQGAMRLQSLPYRFNFAGEINSGKLEFESSNGYWYSRTACSNHVAYYLNVGSSVVIPAINYSRNYGFSLRCITTPTS